MGWLKFEPKGLIQGDEETRQRLAGRSYTLVPTPSDLLVGVPWNSDAKVADGLILAGDLTRIAFAELISLIAHTRTTGTLRVICASGTRSLTFVDGEVRGAATERVGERLGEVAIRMGLLKQEQLDQLNDRVSGGQRTGRGAVEQGMLSEHDLWKAIQEHVIGIFQAILLEGRGTFLLIDQVDEGGMTLPGMAPEPVLMEGVRRLDELRCGGAANGSGAPERVLQAYNAAFRDVFATAEQAGAGPALRRAAASIFAEAPSHASLLRGIEFSEHGELPQPALLERAAEMAEQCEASPDALLAEALSQALLFLLFVAGEHLEAAVHQALHTRAKARVSQD